MLKKGNLNCQVGEDVRYDAPSVEAHVNEGETKGDFWMNDIAAVILAAGQGKRMRSKQPKVMHRIMGRSLVCFPLALARRLRCGRTVVVMGHGRKAVEEEIQRFDDRGEVTFAVQAEQRGTGDAVRSALPKLRGHKGSVLILSGDVPLVDKPTIRKLEKAFEKTAGPLAFISFVPDDPKGYGRVIRERGQPVAIREARDASAKERKIREVNAGIYLIDMAFLKRAVKRLIADNDQGELYLTDLVSMAAGAGGAPAPSAARASVPNACWFFWRERQPARAAAQKARTPAAPNVTLKSPLAQLSALPVSSLCAQAVVLQWARTTPPAQPVAPR